MIACKGCSLAKIQHHSLSSLIRVPHHHFTYDTVLRDSHCKRPKGEICPFNDPALAEMEYDYGEADD
jgi:hypothetical protein